jgi:hypothetical protein
MEKTEMLFMEIMNRGSGGNRFSDWKEQKEIGNFG